MDYNDNNNYMTFSIKEPPYISFDIICTFNLIFHDIRHKKSRLAGTALSIYIFIFYYAFSLK